MKERNNATAGTNSRMKPEAVLMKSTAMRIVSRSVPMNARSAEFFKLMLKYNPGAICGGRQVHDAESELHQDLPSSSFFERFQSLESV
jgi:hypothetical protein